MCLENRFNQNIEEVKGTEAEVPQLHTWEGYKRDLEPHTAPAADPADEVAYAD